MPGILEQLLAEQQKTNTLLEQLVANGVATPTPTADAGAKGTGAKGTGAKGAAAKAAAANKPKHTKDEVVAAVVSVKDAFGAPAAKAITGEFGYARVADAKEEHFDAIFDACQAKLAEQDGNGEEEDV